MKRIVTGCWSYESRPVLLIVAIMVKIKMPGGPAFFSMLVAPARNDNDDENLGFALPENVKEMTDQELAGERF